MEGYDAAIYGERVADLYDHTLPTRSDVAETVELLDGLARDGKALELGIGTGGSPSP